MVPADAEIVIEGFVAAERLFRRWSFRRVHGLSRRAGAGADLRGQLHHAAADAIYHDYASGLTDMLVPDNMAMEGKVFELVKAVAPSLVNVHVPTVGRRLHAYLQLRNPARGEARDALMAALAYRRLKTVFVVDEDVDLFSPERVLWAMATRVQWSRDSIILDGLSGSTSIPRCPSGAGTALQTRRRRDLPPPPRPGMPRAVPPGPPCRGRRERARALLASAQPARWPRS